MPLRSSNGLPIAFRAAFAAAAFFAFSSGAFAYAGLGPLVPMIGNGVLLLFMFVVTGLGILIHPLRLLIGKMRKKEPSKKVTP